jgi:hypothetical protein
MYKHTLSEEYVSAITHALLVFNRAKQFAFNIRKGKTIWQKQVQRVASPYG